jgi:predicted Zn-dependent protease
VTARLGLRVAAAALIIAIGAVATVRLAAERRTRKQARDAIAKGRYDAARPALDRWLAQTPGSAEAHYLKARAALALGQHAEARRELQTATRLGQPFAETERLRAFLLVAAGQFGEAEPILLKLRERSTGPDPEADEALARVLLQSYKLKPAAQVLERWIRDAPKDPRPYMWYTEVDRRLGADQTAAIAHFRGALKIDPGLNKARLGLADALRAAHRPDEAAVEYAAYITRARADPAGHIGAGLNEMERNDLSSAQRHLDLALELAPNQVAALKERAALDVRRKEFAAALERLDRAAALAPLDKELMYRRAIVLTRLGRNDEARAVQRQLDRFREDEAQLNTLREQLNTAPASLQLRYEIARWMFDHGQSEEGLRWSQMILSVQPNHAHTNELLANYYERRGNVGLTNYYRLRATGEAGPTVR